MTTAAEAIQPVTPTSFPAEVNGKLTTIHTPVIWYGDFALACAGSTPDFIPAVPVFDVYIRASVTEPFKRQSHNHASDDNQGGHAIAYALESEKRIRFLVEQGQNLCEKRGGMVRARRCEMCGGIIEETFTHPTATSPQFHTHKNCCSLQAGQFRVSYDVRFGFGEMDEANCAHEAMLIFRDNGHLHTIFFYRSMTSEVITAHPNGFDVVKIGDREYRY